MRFKKLLSDWVLVELEPLQEKTAGGLVVPQNDIYKFNPVRVGRVKLVGVGRRYASEHKFVAAQVEVGTRVAFPSVTVEVGTNKAAQFSLNAGEALIRESDILFVMSDDCTVRVT